MQLLTLENVYYYSTPLVSETYTVVVETKDTFYKAKINDNQLTAFKAVFLLARVSFPEKHPISAWLFFILIPAIFIVPLAGKKKINEPIVNVYPSVVPYNQSGPYAPPPPGYFYPPQNQNGPYNGNQNPNMPPPQGYPFPSQNQQPPDRQEPKN